MSTVSRGSAEERRVEMLTWIRPAYSVESFWTMGSICLHGPHLLNCIVIVAVVSSGQVRGWVNREMREMR